MPLAPPTSAAQAAPRKAAREREMFCHGGQDGEFPIEYELVNGYPVPVPPVHSRTRGWRSVRDERKGGGGGKEKKSESSKKRDVSSVSSGGVGSVGVKHKRRRL